MDLSTWLLFIAVALVAIMSPGPAILLAISNSLQFGFKKVLLSSLGNITGLFIISTTAIFGLGAILKASTTLFLVLKVIGALYLVFIGIKQWKSKTNLFTDKQDIEVQTKSGKTFFLEGLLIAITNPKAIIFFTALFPQFINLDNPVAPQFLIMSFSFMGMSFSVLATYGLLAHKAKKWFSTSYRAKWFNRVIGSIFISLGAAMLQLKVDRA